MGHPFQPGHYVEWPGQGRIYLCKTCGLRASECGGSMLKFEAKVAKLESFDEAIRLTIEFKNNQTSFTVFLSPGEAMAEDIRIGQKVTIEVHTR